MGFWSLYYFSKFLISLNFLLNYSALLFSLSLLGILTNRRSFLLFLLCLEILLLSLILRLIFLSLIAQDFLGELISFILFPLISFLIIGLLGRFIGIRGAKTVPVILIGSNLLYTLIE